ncbi:MAG TPA: glycosyltransferase family 4 protein [Thermoanaerobaculia bacterium]|jgi:glycosyltransferase involved in cell wall biosynthesis|nr:glycosyltransferase family 4 protein [Thermoanaerobaculia bacterium]
MNIAYLMEDTALSGGTRVQLAQADALIARGHRVRIVTKGLPLTWRPSRAEWVYVDDFNTYDAREDDVIIATFWTTLAAAYAIAPEKARHLCQGYEGSFTAYAPIRSEIEAAYRLPIPKLVVTRSLVDICKQFSDDVTYIGQIVDDDFFRPRTPAENEPMRVLLCGESQVDLKGVADGYGAAAHARWFHQKFDLIRVSPWAPSREEPLDSVQEFHVALNTREMTRLMHSCDVLIAPNHAEEGFGLPAAEAMASGIPVVLTAIPSYLSFDSSHDYALFAPQENAVELGEKLIELLSDEDLRERLRVRGREVAEQWRASNVAERMEAALSLSS